MKINKIIYWAVTIITALMYTLSGVMDFIRAPQIVDTIVTNLGYPDYLLDIIGVAKILAAIALVVPRFPRLKEWAYSGLFIHIIGAIWSHLAMNDAANMGGGIMLLLLVSSSYYFYRRVQPAGELTFALN